MNVQEELKALKERIAELEEHVKEEREFPQLGDTYWYINNDGMVLDSEFENMQTDIDGLIIGNMFKTKEQAEFAVEKLRVEAELRKYNRPFKDNDNNYFIELYLFDKTLSIDSSEYFQTQGIIYFESADEAQQAIEVIGEQRIKKYIFGVED